MSLTVCPVMNEESSETMNDTSLATSSGFATLPSALP